MTGIDVADVNRIERLLKYNPTFLDSLFCAEEKEYLALRGNNPETIAEFLSLKEAALKALDRCRRGNCGKLNFDIKKRRRNFVSVFVLD